MKDQSQFIEILDCSQHNLKGISLKIPLNSIVVFTGVSGSGKSTLAMDVIFAEGRRLYLDALGLRSRSGIELWERPDVDSVKGLPPPIALEQGKTSLHPASTVASLTDTATLLRLLFAKCAVPYCPLCNIPIDARTADEITARIMEFETGTPCTVLAPLNLSLRGVPLETEMKRLRESGFVRIRADGQAYMLDEEIPALPDPVSVELVVDRIIIKAGGMKRISDSVRLALREGLGLCHIEAGRGSAKKDLLFTERFQCPKCLTLFPQPTPRTFSVYNAGSVCPACQGKDTACPECDGTGLNRFARNIRLAGWTYPEACRWTVDEAIRNLGALCEDKSLVCGHETALHIAEAIRSRLNPLCATGLGYLALDRKTATLSRGEFQKIRIGIQTAGELTGVLYILDEPSKGLNARETEIVWNQIQRLKSKGNSIIIIEHNLELIRKADHVVEIGPGPGRNGGEILFSGSPGELMNARGTVTGPYLHAGKTAAPPLACNPGGKAILFRALTNGNLKSVDLDLPLGTMVCVTGISGAGKSTMLKEAMYRLTHDGKEKNQNRWPDTRFRGIRPETLRCVLVDQSPLRGSRVSFPASYIGIFSEIRKLYSRTPESRQRGLTPGFFSLAKKGGRCERCRGTGTLTLDMAPLPPVSVRCDMCSGRRFNRDALDVLYRGIAIDECLKLTASEGLSFFHRFPGIREPLNILKKTGLGYLPLGIPTGELSGGRITTPEARQGAYLLAPPRQHP